MRCGYKETAVDSPSFFTHYKQKEDHLTNGLLSLMRLCALQESALVKSFAREVLGLKSAATLSDFRVLRHIDGTADAEICGADCCVRIETKIESGKLRVDQIDSHLARLCTRNERHRLLVLLTPDDSRSAYVRQFVAADTSLLLHVSWRRVHDFLGSVCSGRRHILLAEIAAQLREAIEIDVLRRDVAGIIAKIDFGNKSGVHADRYLDEMRAGKWIKWNTPSKYKGLDETGRRLLLYDRTRKAITVEVEIREVRETRKEEGYPYTNSFAPGTLSVLPEPISVERVRRILPGFGEHRKDRSPYRNITHEQYRQLKESVGPDSGP